MKKLSQKTWEIIQSLYGSPGFWSALVSRQEPPLLAFEEIAKSRETAAIPYLASLLLDSRQNVREAAARTVGALVAALPVEDYAQLDQVTRNDWAYESTATSDWRRLKPSDVRQFCQLPSPAATVGLISFHGSGFVREAAVNVLANLFDGSELPFLLLRVNDWVGTVRESAAVAVLHRIRPDYARHFFRNLWLVDRLKTCGRGQHATLVGSMLALLREPEAAGLLREGLASSDRWLRRQSYQLAIESKSHESLTILKQVLSDKEPILRLWAARSILASLVEDELRRLLPGLLCDRFMPVRCEALSILARRLPGDAPPILLQALLDTHASMRAAAVYFIRQTDPSFDFAPTYRRGLGNDSDKIKRASLMGLGETGQAADGSLVLPYLKNPSVALRKSAIRALAALDGSRYAVQFFDGVADDHPGVSREATKALISKCRPADTDLAWRLFQTDSRQYVRKASLSIITSAPVWTRGWFIIHALGDRDAVLAEMASGLLRDWLEQTRSMPIGPSKEELSLLKAAATDQSPHLSQPQINELNFCLRSYS